MKLIIDTKANDNINSKTMNQVTIKRPRKDLLFCNFSHKNQVFSPKLLHLCKLKMTNKTTI